MKSKSVCVFSVISLLFLANCVSSQNPYSLVANFDVPEHKVVFFDIKGTIQLTCNLTATDTTEQVHVVWLKDGKNIDDIPDVSKKATKSEENKSYKLKITKAGPEDAGNYTCQLQDLEDTNLTEVEISVHSKPAVKLVPNTSVVEGEKLVITCQIISKPEPVITWRIGNETYETSNDRIKIRDDTENGYPNAVLEIEKVELTDRNEYVCMARSNFSLQSIDAESATYVRVKDKLAALWPFLGICAEVVVLCAIILIYEKKRNRTELEESDTDQSPDQKNPDNGKSDVRHRK